MADGFASKKTQGAGNHFIGCRAWENSDDGFDTYDSPEAVVIESSWTFRNGINFGFSSSLASGEAHIFRNNVRLAGTSSDSIANGTSTNNSWNNLAASSADFASLNLGLATAARNPDGTLPDNSLFRLVAGSKLINAGTNVGLPYKGKAPDLGAFERE